MSYHNAIKTAANIAAQLDLPAYVYAADVDTYQVACMRWTELLEQWQRACAAIVTPEGRVFERRWTIERPS